eukprot:jgi/Botrbrau1/1958/Bobra.0052s0003.1
MGSVTVIDNLVPVGSSDQACTWVNSTLNLDIPDIPTAWFQPCTRPLFSNCTNLGIELTLVFQYVGNGQPGPSRMGRFLEILGLSQIIQTQGNIHLYVNSPAAGLDTAVLFPNLQSMISNLIIVDATERASFSSLKAFPALTSVYFITLQATGLTNMTSFSSLICTGAAITLQSNQYMTSLTGLEGLFFLSLFESDCAVPALVFQGNNRLDSTDALAPLSNALLCRFGFPYASARSISVVIPGCELEFSRVSDLCTFILTGTCPSVISSCE